MSKNKKPGLATSASARERAFIYERGRVLLGRAATVGHLAQHQKAQVLAEPGDAYMAGLANGLILADAILRGEEPQLVSSAGEVVTADLESVLEMAEVVAAPEVAP